MGQTDLEEIEDSDTMLYLAMEACSSALKSTNSAIETVNQTLNMLKEQHGALALETLENYFDTKELYGEIDEEKDINHQDSMEIEEDNDEEQDQVDDNYTFHIPTLTVLKVPEHYGGYHESFRNIPMEKSTFLHILAESAPYLPKRIKNKSEVLACTLRWLMLGETVRGAVVAMKRSVSTLHSYRHAGLRALVQALWPKYVGTRFRSKAWCNEESQKWIQEGSCFENCVGIVDAFHIFLRVSDHLKQRFLSRKGTPSTNVLVCCSYDHQFTFGYSGYEGSASDERVFNDSGLRKFIKKDYFLLSDNGFALSNVCLPPYRDEKYSFLLHEQNIPCKNQEEQFNRSHFKAHLRMAQTIDLFRRNFRVFDNQLEVDLETANLIIYTSLALHNVLRIHEENEYKVREPEFILDQREESYQSIQSDSTVLKSWRDALAYSLNDTQSAKEDTTALV